MRSDCGVSASKLVSEMHGPDNVIMLTHQTVQILRRLIGHQQQPTYLFFFGRGWTSTAR